MTTVKEPAQVFTKVPRPVEAPLMVPMTRPVEQPAERELVPVTPKAPAQRV